MLSFQNALFMLISIRLVVITINIKPETPETPWNIGNEMYEKENQKIKKKTKTSNQNQLNDVKMYQTISIDETKYCIITYIQLTDKNFSLL